MIPRIDHARVVRTFRQIDHIPLIRSYLIAVQNVSLNFLELDANLTISAVKHRGSQRCVQ